mmetsp:Transcript_21752/g.44443  ORF Transcript_21752/g.44443 Transcript_21752/m.44443 type:complete len:1071 (-) Transcript_21752:253-3465(-)
MGSCLSTPEVTSTTTAKPQKPSASTSPAVAAKSPVARSQVKGGKDSEASKRIEDGKSNTMGAAGSSPARPAGNSTANKNNGSPITPTKSITSSGYSSPDNTDNNSTSSGKSNKDFDENASTHSQTSRRKSKLICHSDSRVGLSEIICDIGKNPNLVRIEVPLGKPIEEVYEGVHDGPVLGSGISGIVRLVKHRTTQVNYAVKCLDLAMIDSEEGLKQLKEEIYIMCQLDHPNIVRLEEVYESHSEIYLVQEVCKGGELFDRLDEQPDYHYTEAQCARLVKQMLSSVRYIHLKGIIHRDLKLENFLFSDVDPDSELKMIDFGLSKHFTFGEVHHEAVGTPYTVAPEVIRGSYDERCDVWAIGVITYLLLSGEPPFGGCGGPETLMQVRDNILRGDFEFEPEEIWGTVSKDAKDFIRSLLVIDPMQRPTARQAQESKWLKEWAEKENGDADSVINPNVVKALVGFKEYSDMRKLLCEVLSFTLLPDQIQDLRKEFEKYDQDGTGEITLSTLKKVLIGNASTGSLGGLTEKEVEDIFNAMRVRKGETSIHWHDFIAAGLSQCQVDDRNLRLAFERLDADHKGYITFENVMDLMGDETFGKEDAMLKMWCESMKDVDCKSALIDYDDFVLLMKGQKRDTPKFMRNSFTGLDAVPETIVENDDVETIQPTLSKDGSLMELESPDVGDPTSEAALSRTPEAIGSPIKGVLLRQGSSSAPPTPIHYGKRFDDIEQRVDSPVVTEEHGRVSFDVKGPNVFSIPTLDLTPPQSPVRGPSDYVTPTAKRTTLHPQLLSTLDPPPDFRITLPPLGREAPLGSSCLHASLTRGRSVSLDEKETVSVESHQAALFKRDSRRALAIPEHTHNMSDVDRVIGDETKTPLVVNRKLYRAHREFRHAVVDACKRFEDEQLRRAKETLQAQENAQTRHTAGLVMRHGQGLSEQSIKNFLKKTMEEQQTLVDQANRRGGRGRRSRKKTISDMSGMLGPASPDPNDSERSTVAAPKQQENLAPVNENENLLRNPTKPGEFRKTTYDPFQRSSILFNGATRKTSVGSAAEASGGAHSTQTLPPAMPPLPLN